jgi:hypothetical protein
MPITAIVMTLSMKASTRITIRLFAGFVAMLALILVLSYSSITAIGMLGHSLKHAVSVDAELELAGRIHLGFEEMRADSTKVEMSLVNMLVGKLNTKGLTTGWST